MLEEEDLHQKVRNLRKKVAEWKELYTDSVEAFDKHIKVDVSNLEPQVTWGTNPEMGINITGTFPEIKDHNDEKAYDYMGLKTGANSI